MSGRLFDVQSFLQGHRVLTLESGLSLPLSRSSYLDGEAGRGRAKPYFLPTEAGVVVVRPLTLSLHSHDLRQTHWSTHVQGASNGLLASGGALLYGPYGAEGNRERWLLECNLVTGETAREVESVRALLVGFTATTLVLLSVEPPQYSLIGLLRYSLREVWRRDSHPGLKVAASTGEKYFVTTEFGGRLQCLDALTGELLWEFEPPGGDPSMQPLDRWNRIGTGFPSVTIVGDRVIITTLDCQVFAVSVESGELLDHGQAPFRGAYLVTDRSVFFKQPFGLSDFDHREMREVDRVEYRSEVEPLYKGSRPTVNGFWMTEESVIWTTMHGALMGVSRKPESKGRRTTWVDEIPGALMAIGDSPIGHRGHLYYSAAAGRLDGPFGLYCYRSIHSSEK